MHYARKDGERHYYYWSLGGVHFTNVISALTTVTYITVQPMIITHTDFQNIRCLRAIRYY